ncbi:hypothetical protein FQB35_15650 (plasmid) [Crassaminicella thermophila]|uniref:Uncharacterized protein n=1 Tax=Crassaminicella thermophila TaxID=2599308 RepID=A0A5C0SLK3_CRATE|nr:hypothetical protein [Crassaminicella thermophila]QEK13759.1 hypothetical protein FQB35_15650 [Crassaminicella thermophila]
MGLLYALMQKRDRKADEYNKALERIREAEKTGEGLEARIIVAKVLHEELARLDKQIERGKEKFYVQRWEE